MTAKQVIYESKAIRLPAYLIEDETASEKKTIIFDTVVLEKADDRASAVGIVPDCIMQKGRKTLWVEIKVTHAVDESKEQKIRMAGTSTIEIVLIKSIAEEMDVNSLRSYIIEDADRHWIVNGAHQEHLRKIQRKHAVAAANATKEIEGKILSFKPERCPYDLTKRFRFLLYKFSLNHLVGIQNPYPHWFRFNAQQWQTLYLGEILFDSFDLSRSPCEGETIMLRSYNFSSLIHYVSTPAHDGPFGFLHNHNSEIPLWANTSLIFEVEKGRERHGSGPKGFGNFNLAVRKYQEHLHIEKGILSQTKDGRYLVDVELFGRIWRSQRMQRLLWKSIPFSDEDSKRKTINAWMSKIPPGFGHLPEDIASAGGDEWRRLEKALISAQELVNARRPRPIENLLGLPLYRANEAARVGKSTNPRWRNETYGAWENSLRVPIRPITN